MKTATVQIGNSDNKLEQSEWVRFITRTSVLVSSACAETHFEGNSNPIAPWQNYCLVFIIDEDDITLLKEDLGEIGREFGQESIALTIGETEFV